MDPLSKSNARWSGVPVFTGAVFGAACAGRTADLGGTAAPSIATYATSAPPPALAAALDKATTEPFHF